MSDNSDSKTETPEEAHPDLRPHDTETRIEQHETALRELLESKTRELTALQEESKGALEAADQRYRDELNRPVKTSWSANPLEILGSVTIPLAIFASAIWVEKGISDSQSSTQDAISERESKTQDAISDRESQMQAAISERQARIELTRMALATLNQPRKVDEAGEPVAFTDDRIAMRQWSIDVINESNPSVPIPKKVEETIVTGATPLPAWRNLGYDYGGSSDWGYGFATDYFDYDSNSRSDRKDAPSDSASVPEAPTNENAPNR